MKKQFPFVRKIRKNGGRQVNPESNKLNVNLVTIYTPIIKNLQTVIRNNLPILYSDPEMKNIFPEGTINVTYKSLREKFEGTYFLINVSSSLG